MLALCATAHTHLQTASVTAHESPPLTIIGAGGLTVACGAGADDQGAQGRGPNTRAAPSISHAGHPSIYLNYSLIYDSSHVYLLFVIWFFINSCTLVVVQCILMRLFYPTCLNFQYTQS